MEVGEAGRHVAGGATAPLVVPATRQRQQLLNPDLCGNIHDVGGYVPAQVAAWHAFTGRSARGYEGDATSQDRRQEIMMVN